MFEQDIDVSLSMDELIVTKLIHSGLFKGGFMSELFVGLQILPLLQLADSWTAVQLPASPCGGQFCYYY